MVMKLVWCIAKLGAYSAACLRARLCLINGLQSRDREGAVQHLRRTALAILLAVFLSALAPARAGGAQAPPANIKVDVRLVNLNVRVRDRSGEPLPNLRKEDFHVLEDGIPQTLSHFQPVTAPVHLALLLDLSGSTHAKMDIIIRAAARFIDALRPEDNVAVATFSRGLNMISEFTRDRSLLKSRIRALENKGTRTGFYDSLWSALGLLDGIKASRKAIVVMTDGFDSSLVDAKEWPTDHTFEELLARAAQDDSVIYPVHLNTEYDFQFPRAQSIHQAYAKAFKQVEELAQQTGGTLFCSKRIEELEHAYQQVALELRTSYSLAYTPIDSRRNGDWRKIEVKVDRRGTLVRTRPGYYAR
jgi:VWFA-related protein